MVIDRNCAHCGKPLEERRWNTIYCDDACKMRAYRRTKAGLSANTYTTGGKRGRVALGQLTAAERHMKLMVSIHAPFTITVSDTRAVHVNTLTAGLKRPAINA